MDSYVVKHQPHIKVGLRCAENCHKAYITIRRSPGNCKTTQTEMGWTHNQIRRNISRNNQRYAKRGQAEEEVDWQHRGVDRQILRRNCNHGTQPAGVERFDEEVHHDAPPWILVELRDQDKERWRSRWLYGWLTCSCHKSVDSEGS